MRFEFGNGKLSIASLLGAMLLAKILGLLGFYWLSKSLDFNVNESTFLSRGGELIIFLGLIASAFPSYRIPLSAICNRSTEKTTVMRVFKITITVVIIAALFRYSMETLILGLLAIFDPEAIKETLSTTSIANDGLIPLMNGLTSGKAIAQISVVPLVEEVIYRGILLNYLLLRFKALNALVISSLIFAILHGNPIVAFLGGVFFGLIYFSTRNVLYSVLAHSAANATIIVLYCFPSTLFPSDIHNRMFQIWACSISIAWLTAMLVVTLKYRNVQIKSAFYGQVITNKGMQHV